MKTRSTILTLLLMAGFTMFAQKQVEQQGYVRSIGRPDNKYGERLGGATIRVSGQHNDVRSNDNGDFTITFDDATVGVTSYSLSRVRLAGYEVNEKEVIGRQFAVSAKVPHEIVMVSLAVKQALEDSITARIDRRYKAEYAKLEREKEQLGEEYHARLQKLFDEYDKRDQLISEMVERYANTDYAKLDSTAAKINAYIETGELEKADSIIRAMGVAKMESEYKMVREDNDRLRAELQKGEKAQENLYQNLYTAYNGKYEIFAQQFMNDSAAFYLEKIVELDTTNVENLLRTAWFLYEYMALYDNALKVMSTVVRNVIEQYGEQSELLAQSYCNVGTMLLSKGEYDKSLDYTLKSIDIYNKNGGEDSYGLACCFKEISEYYYIIGIFEKAMEYCMKSYKIISTLDNNELNLSQIYNVMGVIYQSMGELNNAYDCYSKALQICNAKTDERNPITMTTNNNMGIVCSDLGDYDNALKYLIRNHNIKISVYGEKHPSVAISYNSLGEIYERIGDYSESLNAYFKSLEIYEELFKGDDNPNVALLCNNIGYMYTRIGDYSKAICYHQRALNIRLRIFGENNHDVAVSYSNIAFVYSCQKMYDDALAYYLKAYNISVSSVGENNGETASVMYNLGKIYSVLGDNDKSLEYHLKALKTKLSLYGENHYLVEYSYHYLGAIYSRMSDYKESLFYFKKDMAVCALLYGENHEYTTEAYSNIYETLHNLAATEPSYSDTISDFLSTKLFVAQFPVDSTSKSELQGELYLLQLDDWNMETVGNVFDLNKSLNGKKKNVVLYKDGKVLNRKLDKKTEFDIILKEVGKDEHDEVIGAWKKTVKKETKLPN